MRVFANEDVYKDLKQLLIDAGHDVVSPIELGMRGAGDEICFLHAAADSRTILTHNGKDFSLLHRAWVTWPAHWNLRPQPSHFGVLSVPHKSLLSPAVTASRIGALVEERNSLLDTFVRLDRAGNWIPF